MRDDQDWLVGELENVSGLGADVGLAGCEVSRPADDDEVCRAAAGRGEDDRSDVTLE
jgi:hypothetical protein